MRRVLIAPAYIAFRGSNHIYTPPTARRPDLHATKIERAAQQSQPARLRCPCPCKCARMAAPRSGSFGRVPPPCPAAFLSYQRSPSAEPDGQDSSEDHRPDQTRPGQTGLPAANRYPTPGQRYIAAILPAPHYRRVHTDTPYTQGRPATPHGELVGRAYIRSLAARQFDFTAAPTMAGRAHRHRPANGDSDG